MISSEMRHLGLVPTGIDHTPERLVESMVFIKNFRDATDVS
jgi:hypothetical protein